MKQENSVESSVKMDESGTPEISIAKLDLYQESLQYEESVVKQKSENEDQETFAAISNRLKTLMKEILKLKTEKPEKWTTEVEDRKMKGLMLMLALRRLSRIQKVRVKDSREKSAEFRQGVDGITLQLQNLLYEVAHLKKEVRKCLEFQSADTEIDLVPIDQFYMEAPENISRPEETVEDAHQQRLAQLHWELEQRRGQTQLSDRLTQEKEKVADVIREQEGKLASLVPRINAILEATQPLQKALDLPLDAKREQQRTSQLLPAPLYTLWVQAIAYKEACDSSIQAEIMGDVEAARKLITTDEDSRTEASDSEGEYELQEENAQRKSSRRSEKKNQESEDTEDSSLKQLLSLHPLHLVLTVKTKDKNVVVVRFNYAQTLRIVTTKCSLTSPESPKPSLTDILNNENLLSQLFPDDAGTMSPNPANEYQLKKLRLSDLSAEHLKIIGRPYKWAQTLSGLSFLSCERSIPCEELAAASEESKDEDDRKDADSDESMSQDENKAPAPTFVVQKEYSETLSWKVSAEHMHHTITAIKRRLLARLALHTQFATLESASSNDSIPLTPEILQQYFPGKVCSQLKSWKPITWTDYESVSTTRHIIGCGAVDSQHFFFKALYQRQTVTLEAFIAISPDYPIVAPVFALKLVWHKEETAMSSPIVRQMESEINTYYSELYSIRSDRLKLISLQLYRLAMCLDILTEATCIQVEAGLSASPAQFHKEKIFFRPARGPDRALPFKYLPKLGVFAQR